MTPTPSRVLVIGSGGAGKTTLVTAIADRLGLPVVHLDQEFWRPGWEPTDIPRWRTRVTELVAADRWVLDGNYGGSLDLRLPRTELIVFLDLPRRVTIPRVLRDGPAGVAAPAPTGTPAAPSESPATSWPGCGAFLTRASTVYSSRWRPPEPPGQSLQPPPPAPW